MKKILSSVAIFLAASLAVFAQDARQRTAETVVADVLAAMPAGDMEARNAQLADLAAAAPASVVEIAKMMKPAAAGVKNNLYEYALSGLVGYLAQNNANVDKVREGFAQAIKATDDQTNKAFLMYWFRFLAKPEDAAVFNEYAGDAFLAPAAVGALVDLDGTEEMIMNLVKDGKVDKSLLADAAARKGLKAAEPYLQEWAASSTGRELAAICESLSKVGSESSLEILKEKSPYAYASLAVALADGSKSKAVAKAAKELMGSEVSAYKAAGAEALMKNNPVLAAKTVAAALKSEDGQYRDAVIDDATALVQAEVLAPIFIKKFAKASEGTKLDLLNWFGDNKVDAAKALVVNSFSDNALASTAIAAAGKIGGSDMASALLKQLSGSNEGNSNAAYNALKALKGDFKSALVAELASAQNKEPLMRLASAMKIKEAAPAIFGLLQNGDADAAQYLAGVVGKNDVAAVGKLVEAAKGNLPALQKALAATVKTMSADEQYSTVSKLVAASKTPENFYSVLAQTGTDNAVADLSKAFSEGSAAQKAAAFTGLLNVNNFKAAPVLLAAAKSDPASVAKALPRYVSLVQAYEKNLDKKRADFAQALGLADTKELKNTVINALGKVPTMKAFLLAGKYIDDKDASYAAANALKDIAAKTKEEINYSDYKTYLEKAQAVFRSTGNGDDVYAVDEIAKMLTEAEPSPVYELTAEEKKQGYEILFDGTSMDKWQGDLEGYIPVNGAIYVSANYGSTGNLYTKKEYRNFVLRFEFCFLREGVNNGVGVRTPMGVDAAYGSMCELQILDHDAPMYANLRDYQVHGSVYGVIPAKRVVHKPLGEWSTQEIRVEGDRIKVIVNGEVILDGDVRKACKGHNVAPDGSNTNPYTVDKRNHPGMFNERGYISFCGHGEGLKLRNIRVLDLGDKK